jgi:hypothetical protein
MAETNDIVIRNFVEPELITLEHRCCDNLVKQSAHDLLLS